MSTAVPVYRVYPEGYSLWQWVAESVMPEHPQGSPPKWLKKSTLVPLVAYSTADEYRLINCTANETGLLAADCYLPFVPAISRNQAAS
jgi:hypothetical protein